MKQTKYLLLTLLCMTVMASCQSEPEEQVPIVIETVKISEVGYTEAACAVEIKGTFDQSGVCFATSEYPTTASECIASQNKTKFTCELTGLKSGQKYYLRAYATHGNETVYSTQKSFTTYKNGEPLVKVTTIADITYQTATFNGMLMSEGGQKVTERGFCYGQSAYPTVDDNKIAISGVVGKMAASVSGLDDGNAYHVRAYAAVGSQIYYSSDEQFLTIEYNKPTATILSIDDIESDSFTIKCTSDSDNDLEITERGIYISEQTDMSSATKVKATTAGKGDYSVAATGLKEASAYYVQAYAINRKGESKSKTTMANTLDNRPLVTTGIINRLTGYTAKGALEVTSLGAKEVPLTEAGLCFSTSAAPTISDTKVVAEGLVGLGKAQHLDMRWLKAGTTYHVRAYATNMYGTQYGTEETFTTREDLYKGYIRHFNEGKTLPYTNAIKYAPGYIVADSVESYQHTTYANIQTAVTTYGTGRLFTQLVLVFLPTASGKEAVQLRLYYTNAAQTSTYAGGRSYYISRDENGLFTFSNMGWDSSTTGKNGKLMYEAAAHTDLTRSYLDEVYNFIVGDKIVIDWAHPAATTAADMREAGQIRLSRAGDTTKTMVFGTYNFSYSAETPLTDW